MRSWKNVPVKSTIKPAMKGFFLLFAAISCIAVSSCNNDSEKPANSQKAKADSLMTLVMDGHNIGMAKWSRIVEKQKEIQTVLDSIARLPEKERNALEPVKTRMENVQQQLEDANNGMVKWMDDFRMDSARDDPEQRIKYLLGENIKVTKVKDEILGSLQRADSVLRSRY
jgi:hypothetical protein